MAELTLSIDKTSNVPLLLGGTTTFTLKIRNTSSNIRLYNLNIYLTLPDGITLYSGALPETSKATLTDGGTKSSWINLKDLAPMEIDYTFNITVKGGTTFKNGSTIPFGYIFTGILVKCEMDTMPRGSYDVGNQKVFAESTMTFKTVRFYNTLTTPSKVLKGAGASAFTNNYTKIYTATCNFYNNAVSTSTMNITILLENGIRYLGNISVSGTDGQKFLSPVITTVNINGKYYVQLYYGNITLSKSSITTLNFKYAVWNKYDQNTGDIIEHGTKINILSNMSSIEDSVDSSCSFSAMDLIITTSVNKETIDIDETLQFSYTYEVGGYYVIHNIDVDYILPDGISYISSSVEPYYAADDPVVKGFGLKYTFASEIMNSLNTITISGKMDSNYRYKFDEQHLNLPVVSFDNFIASASIVGTKTQVSTTVTDGASTSCSIKLPTILKEFLKGYYSNGALKTISSLSSGDLAEYRLTYDAKNLKAIQKQIYLDDFFPLSADPIDNLNYSIIGYNPSFPQLIDPHGVDFYYGIVPGNSLSTITFKVPIKYPGTAPENINLLKLKGINTDGFSYSSRMQVTVNIGSPNIQLTKTVSGPNKNAVKATEIYNYTVKISNTNNLGTETDAFNFVLSDELSPWFTINSASISVNGTGTCDTPSYDANKLQVLIYKLSPGQYITLNYSVTISSDLSPGLTVPNKATNTNPYSQANYESYQYTNQAKSATTTISSANITLTKTNYSDLFKVNSLITYIISLTVPQGTIAYDVYVKDILPSGGQSYVGNSTREGISITPTISNNTITFPKEGTIDARTLAVKITYSFQGRITNANKTVGTITSNQTNNCQTIYKQTPNGGNIVISKNLTITVNHPNLLLTLTARDNNTSEVFNSSANIDVNSTLDFKLTFFNNSNINLINATIEIPISNGYAFFNFGNSSQGTAYFDSTNKKIIISVPSLESQISGFIYFTLKPLPNLNSGTYLTTVATAVQYYNNIATKVYSGEQSNTITAFFKPGVSLLPTSYDKINDSTSFRVTTPGYMTTIINNFINTGGGYDDYTILIKPVAIEYTLYIDAEKIANVSPNTSYQADPDIMKGLAPNKIKIIKITAIIPKEAPLGSRFDFIITVRSKTSPYPEKTVLNIDPS